MRSRAFLRCVPALVLAGPGLALPGEGPTVSTLPTTEAAVERPASSPSAAFLAAVSLRPQGEPAAPVAPVEPASVPPTETPAHEDMKLHVFAFYEEREFDELTIDPDSDNTGFTGDVDVFDVDQTRFGMGAAFGKRNLKGFFKVFADSIGDEPLEFDGFGMGGGVAGTPIIADISADANLTLPYRVEFSGAFNDTDNDQGPFSGDLVYIENRLEVGVGVEWMGLHPSLGVQTSSIVGFLSDDITDIDNTNDYLVTGFNPGFYAGIGYKHPEFPVFVDLRFLAGDVSGWTGALGASF